VAILLVLTLLWLIVCYLRVWLSCCVIRYKQLLLGLVGLVAGVSVYSCCIMLG